MCTFCKALINRKKIAWQERGMMVDDNFCGTICNYDCDRCCGCDKRLFTLTPLIINGNVCVSVDYYREAYGTVIYPFSEFMQLSFCPFCGKQISKDVVGFDKQPECYSILEES